MPRLSFTLAVMTLCSVAGIARAQDAPRTLASKEFQRGLALAKSGELDAAADAFQSAYRASPHHAVLYNLGQAYIGLGKPVEAIETLERFLSEGDAAVEPARRREVEALILRQRERVGFVELAVEPEGAQIFVDGKTVAAASLSKKLPLAAGHHLIVARKEPYAPRVQSVQLGAGETVRISLTLEMQANAYVQLSVGCELRGVEVSVDGNRRGITPLQAPLLVPPGRHSVRFERAGYRSFETSLTVRDGAMGRVACSMPMDLTAVKPGRLKIAASEPFARVSVNGARYRGEALPPGPHVVGVGRAGFRPWSRIVRVEPGGSHAVFAILEPTPEHRAELEADARRKRTLAVGFAATGVALAGTSAGLFVWNSGRFDEWQVEGELDADRAADVQRVDDLALGAAVTGAAALVTAGILWLTSGP